jgi:hypothetical protein
VVFSMECLGIQHRCRAGDPDLIYV